MVHCQRVGYGVNVIQQSACLVIGPVAVNNTDALLRCRMMARTSCSVVLCILVC